jgi:pimeloyl-ACP methyl ester carboxylesterase
MERIEVDGATLAYVEAGSSSAEPVVLLHGYLGSHRTWRHQIEPLSRTHRVIALDWFGWGESGRDPGLAYDYDTEVARLGRVLDALGLESCNLVGHDYGGFLALGFCQGHPTRVRRLALLNTRAHRTFNPVWYTIFGAVGLAARAPVLPDLLRRLPLTRIHRRLMSPLVDAGIFDRPSLESYIGWMSSDPDGPAFFARFYHQYRVAARPELARGLADIGCPTAVIWGARDEYLSFDIAQELERDIPRARLTPIYEAGHFVTEHRPAEVIAALEQLLAIDVGDSSH